MAEPILNSRLLTYLRGLFPLSEELSAELSQVIVKRSVRRKTKLVKEGELCTTMFFIVKGLSRAYLIRRNKDITLWLSTEDEFETAVEGFFNHKPAKENIETLEDCQLETIDARDLAALALKFPEVNGFITQMMQEYYIGSEERALMGRLPNANDRYDYLLEIRPHLLNRVPLKYIASFLGIRFETLSRLRNKKAKDGL